MARIVNIYEAKTSLSKLVSAAVAGEEIIIARNNVPLVRLELLESAKPSRSIGFAKGYVKLSDDFDEPLDDFSEYQ